MTGIINGRHQSPMRTFWEWWKWVGKRIGDFQARLILILFYFLVLSPFALGIRWFGDPLAIKDGTRRGWRLRSNNEVGVSIERATQQF